MLSKKFIVALSAVFLSSASFAETECDSYHDEYANRNAAAFHHTISKSNSSEAQWWDDYVNSGERNIVKYVDDLADRDHKAATWFLLTGGKYGFAKRKATSDEELSLLSAMKKVARGYSQSSASQEGGLEEWSVIIGENHPGHLHLKMIYKEIKDLKKTNSDLKVQFGDLKSETSQKLLGADERLHKLRNDMAEETKSRSDEINKRNEEADTLSQQGTERKISEVTERFAQEDAEFQDTEKRLREERERLLKEEKEEREKRKEAFEAFKREYEKREEEREKWLREEEKKREEDSKAFKRKQEAFLNALCEMMRAQTDRNAQFTSLVLALQKTQADFVTQAAQRDEL